MNKQQTILGTAIAVSALIFGSTLLSSDMLFFRLIIGMALGYALTRSFFGFAGSVNRAYHGGSTQLMRVLMFMFVVTAIVNAGFLFNSEPTSYNLWINPINAGLVLGGLFFGFGMTFSSCCASGVLTDLVTDLPRAAVVLLFFGLGIYLGFPIQSSQPWITDTLISSSTYEGRGVFLPDLFPGNGLIKYIGAIALTALFALVAVVLSKRYEDKRRSEGTYYGIDTEIAQQKAKETPKSDAPFRLFSQKTYHRLFVTPWSMKAGAIMIVIIFALMLAATSTGWGASTPFGIWIGQAMVALGVPVEEVAAFAGRPVGMFARPFFEHPISVQNTGIILGTLVCVLLMGDFKISFNYSAKQLALFALGGLMMGLGTRFANGCNVGALYTPIANMSLSGWIFFVFLVLGGILGNRTAKRIG